MRHIVSQNSPYAGLENGIVVEVCSTSRCHQNHDQRRQGRAREHGYPLRRLANYETKAFALFVGLALLAVCIVSFLYCIIYHSSNDLTTTATWKTQPSSPPSSDVSRIIDFNDLSRNPSVLPEERYLAYLPHSGFHNQRIALENAIVLARMLNRTLLVPPMRLGKGIIRYFPFDRLYHLNALSGKDHMIHCNSPPSSWTSLPVNCLDHFDYTLIPWNWMSSLSSIESEQKLLYRWNASHEWLHDSLGISDNDTFKLKDTSHVQYRFVDSDPMDSPGSRYEEAIAVSLLGQVPHRLLQIGTLFGSSRIRLRRRKNINSRVQIRGAMVFTNEILLKTAETIKSRIGNVYLAAHLRLDDGRFASKAEETARLVWWRLLHDVLDFDDEEILNFEYDLLNVTSRQPPHIPEDVAATRSPHVPLPPLNLTSHKTRDLPCRGEKHDSERLSSLNVPLYISTDVSDPFNHPSLRIFRDTFPCTFFLADFRQETMALDGLTSGYDGLKLKEFLIPFLDSIVASRSHEMVGTRGSTFSQFTEDVLWRSYHGFEILQRG